MMMDCGSLSAGVAPRERQAAATRGWRVVRRWSGLEAFDGWPPSPVGRKGPSWPWPWATGGMGALAALGGSLLMCQSGGLTGLIGGGAKVNQAATA